MKAFMDDMFLLRTDTAAELFAHIRNLPIVDYHCHLNPAEIADNRHFNNITEIWLSGDHYKWRLMRANGVDEALITGTAPDFDKFTAWCSTLEDCIGSPLYHWAHLELRRYFGYDGLITGDRAAVIYDHCNEILRRDDFNVASILQQFNIRMLATTDDPIDSLEHHRRIKAAGLTGMPEVLPTFRPSKALEIKNPGFADYVRKLGEVAGITINNWEDFLAALSQRIAFFNEIGCRASDHSLEPPVFDGAEARRAEEIFAKSLRGEAISPQEAAGYQTRLMLWLGKQYAAKGWIMQLHMGALRNNNTRMAQLAGPDTGFDSMSDEPFAWALSRLLDALESRDALPKTILYAINPVFDDMLSAMIGNFQGRGIRGRMQWGCPWWFNDNKHGIQKHLTTLANNGLLARFIGMLTDSRSFMSYPRHEYFRRILAQTLGSWVENGEFPRDMDKLRKIAGDIAYNNVKEYFNLC